MTNVLRNDYAVPEKIALQLAGLKAQILWGDADANQRGRFKNLLEYVPTALAPKQSTEVWVNGIIEAHGKLKGKTPLQAKVLYLETVKQFKLYGCTFFPVRYDGFGRAAPIAPETPWCGGTLTSRPRIWRKAATTASLEATPPWKKTRCPMGRPLTTLWM